MCSTSCRHADMVCLGEWPSKVGGVAIKPKLVCLLAFPDLHSYSSFREEMKYIVVHPQKLGESILRVEGGTIVPLPTSAASTHCWHRQPSVSVIPNAIWRVLFTTDVRIGHRARESRITKCYTFVVCFCLSRKGRVAWHCGLGLCVVPYMDTYCCSRAAVASTFCAGAENSTEAQEEPSSSPVLLDVGLGRFGGAWVGAKGPGGKSCEKCNSCTKKNHRVL